MRSSCSWPTGGARCARSIAARECPSPPPKSSNHRRERAAAADLAVGDRGVPPEIAAAPALWGHALARADIVIHLSAATARRLEEQRPVVAAWGGERKRVRPTWTQRRLLRIRERRRASSRPGVSHPGARSAHPDSASDNAAPTARAGSLSRLALCSRSGRTLQHAHCGPPGPRNVD